jgi:hypothetical protein
MSRLEISRPCRCRQVLPPGGLTSELGSVTVLRPGDVRRIYTPAMRISVLSLLVCALVTFPFASRPSFAQNPPTVADAKAFVDRANADLLKVGVDASHAEWTAETNITEDTQMTSARE